MIRTYFSRITIPLLLVIAILSLIGMGMNSLVIESVAFHTDKEPPVLVNAPYARVSTEPQEIAITFFYSGYGNTALRLAPRGCFLKGWRLNGVLHPFPDNKRCGQWIMDFGNELRPGNNTLEMSMILPPPYNHFAVPYIGFAVGPPLFGYHAAQSLFTLAFLLSLLALGWRWLSSQDFDLVMRVIFCAACLLYLQGLYRLPSLSYSVDLEKHTEYLLFLAQHFFHPYTYTGAENWQPPLFYWIYVLIIKAVEWTGAFDVWTGLRFFSLLSYAAFLYFGMRSIRYVLQAEAGYLAMALLAFWPSGLLCASWIFNDALLYPFYAACFYYTLVWYDNGEPATLSKALIAGGLAFMVKTSAVVPVAILGISGLFAMITGRYTRSRIMDSRAAPGWYVLAAGVVFNLGKSLYYTLLLRHQSPDHYLGGSGIYKPHLTDFLPLHVGDLFQHPFFIGWNEPSLWNLQIRTMLFTNVIWRNPLLGSCLQLLCLVMLAYIAAYCCILTRSQCYRCFPLLAALVIPFTATVAFTWLVHMGSAMDFRYIRPMIIALIIVLSLAFQEMKTRKLYLLYIGGIVVSLSFIELSLIMFEMQMI